MTGITFKSYTPNEIKEANETAIYGIGGFAASDYNAIAASNNYEKLGRYDYLFGCVVENGDTQYDVAAFISCAALNPHVAIIMIQYPENNDNIDWKSIKTYLEEHNFINLHSYDQRLAYGRFTLI